MVAVDTGTEMRRMLQPARFHPLESEATRSPMVRGRFNAAGGSAIIAGILLLSVSLHLQAKPVTVTDGSGVTVTVSQPLQRIISLAPSLTDMVFDLGAERKLIGAIAYDSHPPGAKQLLSVGTVAGLNYERILKLKPQLVLAWAGGTPAGWIKRLRELKIPVYVSRTQVLKDISATLRDIAVLAGVPARDEARRFDQRLQALRQQYADKSKVSVFYQVWAQPLMSLNRRHIIADAIRSCGGDNIFAGASTLIPRINAEAVLAARPQVIATSVAGGPADGKADGLARWDKFSGMPAVRHKNFVVIDANRISRPTPNILDAVQALCDGIDRARRKR